jgi:hypothetical protein
MTFLPDRRCSPSPQAWEHVEPRQDLDCERESRRLQTR